MAWNRADALEALAHAQVESSQRTSGLQVFGLTWPSPIGVDYLTFDEAVQATVLDVTEIDEGGRVSTIKVVNMSDRLVFLMAGELLVGCKQDRVINASIMMPAKDKLNIPATCVEAGRWSYRSRKFSSGGTSSHGLLRKMMSRQAAEHYKARGIPGSDQAAVWAEVAKKMANAGSGSLSGALQDMYKDYASRLEDVLAEISAPDGCHGAAFAVHGKIRAADLFDKPTTLKKLWSKLIKSYAMDALEDPKDKPSIVQPEQILEWVKAAGAAKQQWFDSPGVGYDVRIEGERSTGAALVVEEHLVHLELFQEESAAPEGD